MILSTIWLYFRSTKSSSVYTYFCLELEPRHKSFCCRNQEASKLRNSDVKFTKIFLLLQIGKQGCKDCVQMFSHPDYWVPELSYL
jgi:hypothetical protein